MRNIEEQIQQIDELTENLSISKYNFFKISTLIRLIEESWANKHTCETCNANIALLDKMLEDVDKLDDIEVRAPYEKNFNQMRRHFHKQHDFIPPGFNTGRWTILCILIGGAAALIVSLFWVKIIEINLLLGGLGIGLIAGYFIGTLKDAKKRSIRKII